MESKAVQEGYTIITKIAKTVVKQAKIVFYNPVISAQMGHCREGVKIELGEWAWWVDLEWLSRQDDTDQAIRQALAIAKINYDTWRE